jgi:hypothetical protein
MRTKALLTSILLGSLSLAGVASANPIIRDHRAQATFTVTPAYYQRPVYQQPVYQQPAQQIYGYQIAADGVTVRPYTYGNDPRVEYTPRSSWMNLGNRLQFAVGANRIELPINNRLTALELQSQWGTSVITQVTVRLKDGRYLNVRPDRALDAQHSPNMRIDLGPSAACGVVSVTVQGRGTGTFRVLGA